MTYRDRPILPVVASGEPIEENHTCWALAISAQVLWELRQAGFPATACFSPFHSAAHWLVVTVPHSYRGQAVAESLVGQLAQVLFRSRAGSLIPKTILLGDDIDPANLEEVVWAFAARCHPQRGQFLFPDQEVLPLLAYLDAAERAGRGGAPRRSITACRPASGPRSSFHAEVPSFTAYRLRSGKRCGRTGRVMVIVTTVANPIASPETIRLATIPYIVLPT